MAARDSTEAVPPESEADPSEPLNAIVLEDAPVIEDAPRRHVSKPRSEWQLWAISLGLALIILPLWLVSLNLALVVTPIFIAWRIYAFMGNSSR